jgi:hypothetical protein
MANKGLLLLGGAAALGLALAGKRSGAAVPSPTSKPVDQRMAEVLATNDPAAIRFEAGRLKQEGYPAQAAELEKAARILDSEIAAGARPAPVRGAGFPVSGQIVKSPGWPQPAPSAVTPESGFKVDVGPAVIADVPATAVPPSMYLRQGSSGAPVTTLQLRLNALGFPVGEADGKFGPRTAAAVKSFQKSRKLTVDGVVGPQTAAALFKG